MPESRGQQLFSSIQKKKRKKRRKVSGELCCSPETLSCSVLSKLMSMTWSFQYLLLRQCGRGAIRYAEL